MRFRKNKIVIEKQQKESLKTSNYIVKNENVNSECSHSFGFLAIRPNNSPIPQECLCCLKVIDCLYENKKIKNR